MTHLSRFSVSMDSGLLERFDQQLEKQGYPNRSNAIADLIRESMVHQQWTEGEEVAAAIIMVFDHHKRDLSHQLTHIQHDYHHIIISSQHVHLDHNNCLEIIIVRGSTAEVQALADKLRATKGVNYLTLAAASTGQGL
jgi:CopG family transcriptional regulator, nickel-responsive regulator